MRYVMRAAGMMGLLMWLTAFSPAAAQDQFGFLPKGGSTLLVEILEDCDECDELAVLSTLDKTAEEWRQYFEEQQALGDLSEAEVDVLVHYLVIYFPREAVSDAQALPRDGRAMVATNCHLCHTVAIAVTQDRSLERWATFGTMPPHDTLNIDQQEWTLLAGYLASQTPIAMERIPEELRRGAGGY